MFSLCLAGPLSPLWPNAGRPTKQKDSEHQIGTGSSQRWTLSVFRGRLSFRSSWCWVYTECKKLVSIPTAYCGSCPPGEGGLCKGMCQVESTVCFRSYQLCTPGKWALRTHQPAAPVWEASFLCRQLNCLWNGASHWGSLSPLFSICLLCTEGASRLQK